MKENNENGSKPEVTENTPGRGALEARARREELKKLKDAEKKRLRKKSIILGAVLCVIFFAIAFVIGIHSHGGDTVFEAIGSGIRDLSGQYVELDMEEAAFSPEVPYLMQSDKRWRDFAYGDGTMKENGCGPTCISMVALYLTNNRRFTPKKVARYAKKNGFYVKGQGTSWDMMTDGSFRFGLVGNEITLDEQTMIDELKADHPIIASMGPGDFTDEGHFIVITSYKGGKFNVNDPNSLSNTKKKWTYDELKDQIKGLWSFEAYTKFFE